jgi:hypothetical protein
MLQPTTSRNKRLQLNCDICGTQHWFFVTEHPRLCQECRLWLEENDHKVKNVIRMAKIFKEEYT